MCRQKDILSGHTDTIFMTRWFGFLGFFSVLFSRGKVVRAEGGYKGTGK